MELDEGKTPSASSAGYDTKDQGGQTSADEKLSEDGVQNELLHIFKMDQLNRWCKSKVREIVSSKLLLNRSSFVCSNKTNSELEEKRDQVLPTTTVRGDPLSKYSHGISGIFPSLLPGRPVFQKNSFLDRRRFSEANFLNHPPLFNKANQCTSVVHRLYLEKKPNATVDADLTDKIKLAVGHGSGEITSHNMGDKVIRKDLSRTCRENSPSSSVSDKSSGISDRGFIVFNELDHLAIDFLPSLVSDQSLHLSNKQDKHDGGPRFNKSCCFFSRTTCSQSITPTVAGPPRPQGRSAVLQDSGVCTQESTEPDGLVEKEAYITAVNYSVTNTEPTLSHLQTVSSDLGSSRRDSSCLPRSHSVPSLSPLTSTKNKTFTRANSLPDMLLKNSFEEFTPDIDEDDETYRFQCSCPGLYQCRVTGLVFHMEGEGDVDYRTVPWNRRVLAQHHKKPAGPLFDIKCVQQSMCQLHLPHCEIRSTGGCDFLSVAHVNDEGIEFITPHKITETHVVINITGFSGFGNVKDEDSPPDPVRALVLLFYRPPVDPDLDSLLNVLLLPGQIKLWNVKRTRKKLFGDENFIQTSPQCELHPKQEYTLSTCPEDDSVLVQPTEAKFHCDDYDNYFSSFQVDLEKPMKHIKLLLRNTNKVKVWERRVCLWSTGVKRSSVQGSSDDSLLDIRSSFVDGISGPVLKSLLDKMFEKKVMTDSERESADEIQNKRDKARFVFDTVRNKGEAASSEMTDFLCEVDPFLSEHLGLI